MVRTPERAAERWESGIQDSAPDAIRNYDGGLAKAVTAYSNETTQGKMNTAYTQSQSKRVSRYGAAMTEDKAGAAYRDRMVQIGANGFTDYVKSKVRDSINLKQYLGRQVDAVVTLIDANTASGDPAFKPALDDIEMKKLVVNMNIQRYSDSFTTATTPLQIEAHLKANSDTNVGIKNKA